MVASFEQKMPSKVFLSIFPGIYPGVGYRPITPAMLCCVMLCYVQELLIARVLPGA